MKILISFLTLMLIYSCGRVETVQVEGKPAQECTIQSKNGSSFLVCPDGTEVEVGKGADGKNGSDGKDGTNGKDGSDGKDGVDGKDGTSCTIVDTTAGANITCGNITVSIDDGNDAAVSAHMITELIDPCGDNPNQFDEIILKLHDGSFVAYFENGSNRFLSTIGNGNYQTTDAQSCQFSITNNNEISFTEKVTASRERPSGDYKDFNRSGLISAKAPSTLHIPQTNINPQGLWAEIKLGDVSYCYQAGNGTSNSSRTLTLKHSVQFMTGDCIANIGLGINFAANTEITTETVYMRALNSGKVGSTHTTTTIEANIFFKK